MSSSSACACPGRPARATRLDVALHELARGRAQDVRARQVGTGQAQGHDVLELVAEAERAARLIVAGARPQAAADVLVEEPAVHEHVEGVVRRLHLHDVEHVVPRPARGVARRLRRRHLPVPAEQRGPGPGPFPGRAGRRGGAALRGQGQETWRTAQGRGPRRRGAREPSRPERAGPRATGCGQERLAVARGRAQRLARVREGHAPAKSWL